MPRLRDFLGPNKGIRDIMGQIYRICCFLAGNFEPTFVPKIYPICSQFTETAALAALTHATYFWGMTFTQGDQSCASSYGVTY